MSPLSDSDSQTDQNNDIVSAEAVASTTPFSEEYTLDHSDTRVSVTRTENGSSIVTPYSQVSGHKVVGVGSDTLTYDADGRRLTDATRKITYDALGRVAQIHTADGSTLLGSHEYDSPGRWSGGKIGAQSIRRFHFSGGVSGGSCCPGSTYGRGVAALQPSEF